MSKSPLFVGLIALVALLLLLIFGIASVGPSLKNQKVNGEDVLDQPQPTVPTVDFGNPGIGPTDAELTIVYYGDYGCPSCASFDATLRQSIAEYPNRIRLVWKDLPNIRLHPEARNAALAARCAGEQGAFWEYHDLLLQNQSSLMADNYILFAQETGLDTDSFGTCLQERRPEPLIDRDLDEATSLGVTATPYTFIGDTRRTGVITTDNLELLIQKELSGGIAPQ